MSTNDGVMKISAPLGALTPEAIIQIAEEVDLPTLRSLMACSVAMKKTLESYEHSICQKRIQNLPIAPLPTIHGNIQAPLTGDGKDLRADTFHGVRELTTRAERVEILLAPGSFLRNRLEEEPIYKELQAEERASLLYGLERAVSTADRIADAITDVRIQQEIKHQEREAHRAALEAQGIEVPRPADVTDPRCRWYDPTLATKAALREEHLGHLKAIINHIPKRDLVFLWFLTDIAGRAFVQHECGVHDEDPWTNMTAFKETFLSIGSMALWGYFNPVNISRPKSISSNFYRIHMPRDKLRMYTQGAIKYHLMNITEWEFGPRAITEAELDNDKLKLPGLYLTIRNAFAKLHGINFENEEEEDEEEDWGFGGDYDDEEEEDSYSGEEFGHWEDENSEEEQNEEEQQDIEEDEEPARPRESREDRITHEMCSFLRAEIRIMSGIRDEDDDAAEDEQFGTNTQP